MNEGPYQPRLIGLDKQNKLNCENILNHQFKPAFCNGGESHDFRILKNGGLLSKPLDSGKTFSDIYVNTDQIDMGFKFKADTPGK